MLDVKTFKEKLIVAIAAKNSWGKIEIIELVTGIYIEMLEESVRKAEERRDW